MKHHVSRSSTGSVGVECFVRKSAPFSKLSRNTSRVLGHVVKFVPRLVMKTYLLVFYLVFGRKAE